MLSVIQRLRTGLLDASHRASSPRRCVGTFLASLLPSTTEQSFHCLPRPHLAPAFSTNSSPVQSRANPDPKMSDHLSNLKQSLDAFALDMYHDLAKNPATAKENLFLSPLSISSALLLVYLGAKENTKKELDALLHFEKNFAAKKEDLLAAFGEVLSVFVSPKDDKGNDLYKLSLANKAYIDSELQVKPEYLNYVQKNLKGEIGQVNFQKNAEQVRKEINSWVEGQTNNKIRDLLAAGAVDATTVMVLVNAIYFKANWMNKFKDAETKKEEFHTIDGKSAQVDLMHLAGKKMQYFDNFEADQTEVKLPPFQLVEIPYQEAEMSMLVFLPRDKNGIADLENALTAEQMDRVSQQTRKREVNLWLPRFKLEQTIDLKESLQHLGVRDLFGKADLSGISERLSVSGAVHKAFVEVNEEGTEAAAATAVMMTRCLPMTPPPPVEVRADHPFIFAIRHEKTGLLTFIGRVAKF